MKILTKEVLTAFIADSNQSYIAGMLSNKIEGVSFYAEFIRKPMIQKKHKVELLYSAVSDVQDGQEEENISLFHDELNFMGYIVDNETFYLFDAKKEDVEQLRLFGFEAGDMPENLKEMMKNEVEEYIRNKYIPTEASVALFFVQRPEQEIRDATISAAHSFVTGEKVNMVERFIINANLCDEAAYAFWLADKDNWLESLLQMRKYKNDYYDVVDDRSMKETVVYEKVMERILADSIESDEKYLRLKKLFELIKDYKDVKLLIKRQAKDEKPVVAHCDVFSLTYINTFKQDGLYLRDGELWVNPSAEPFFSIQDALDFSRLARSTADLLKLVEQLQAKGVHLVSNKENIDTSTPTGRLMLTMIGAINEFERCNLLERQREGIAIAKAQGKFKGRKEVKADDFAAQYQRYLNRELNKAQLAKTLGISRPTLDKLIRQHTTA